MKSVLNILAVASALLVLPVTAQDEGGSVDTNAPPVAAGGLQIEGRTDQERIEFLHNVATVYFEEDDFENAINAYQRILEIDPENREARFIIGHVYINAKRYAEAIAMLTELIEEYPEDFQLKNNLAWLYATAEDPALRDGERAIELAQEALVLAPNDHHVWSTLSEAYYVTGQYEKAFRAIEQMARLAQRYGKNITQEMVDGYNEQIRKCKRAWDSEKVLKGDSESGQEQANNGQPDSDDPAQEPSGDQ